MTKVCFLPETTSEAVINKLKHHFARHDISDIVITDNGAQYSSDKFKIFSKKWNFKHKPISQKTLKLMVLLKLQLKLLKDSREYVKVVVKIPYIVLLNLRITPTEGLNASPTQRQCFSTPVTN